MVVLLVLAVAIFSRSGRDPGLEGRLRRLERSVERLNAYVGLEPARRQPGEPSDAVREAVDTGRKIDAIRLYRQETGVGLKEAKEAVEAFERTGRWGRTT